MRRLSVLEIVILVLIAIGLLVSLRVLFIPILVLGVIFLLYKFPPSRWKAGSFYKGSSQKSKRKNGKFRVISGNKNDDDEFPKFH